MAVSAGAGKLAAVQAIMLKQDAEALPVHSETTHEPDSESAIVLAVNFNLPGPQRAQAGSLSLLEVQLARLSRSTDATAANDSDRDRAG